MGIFVFLTFSNIIPIAEKEAAKNPAAPIRMSKYIVPLIHLACCDVLSSFAIPRVAKNNQTAAKRTRNNPNELCMP